MFLPSLVFVVKISSNFPRDVHIRQVTLPPLQIGFSTNLGQSDDVLLDVPKNELILIIVNYLMRKTRKCIYISISGIKFPAESGTHSKLDRYFAICEFVLGMYIVHCIT